MALINDPRLYSGGSERLDSRPHTHLYAQLMARKQARNDAFDEYFRNMNKNINPAGLRNQERAVFEEKLKNWQQSAIDKKELLRNPRKDNGQASMEFQAGYQDILNLVSESKQKEELKKPWVEIYSDPNKRDRINHEKAMASLSLHDMPIYKKNPETGNWDRDDGRRDFNITDIEFDPKPFEQDKFFKGLDDVKPSRSSEGIVKNPKDLTQTVTTTSAFSPQDRDVIASRAVGEYGQNKSFQKFIDELDPSEYNDAFKAAYGTDIQDRGDLAAAYALKGKQQSAVTTKIEDDSFAQKKALARLNDALSRGRMVMRREWQKTDKKTQDVWVDGQLQGILGEAKKGGQIAYKDDKGNWKFGFNVPLDPNLANALKVGDTIPDAIRLTAEGKIQPIYIKYEKDKNGVTKPKRKADGEYEIDEQLSVPLNYNQIKAAYSKQFGVKQANLEMGGMDGQGDESESETEIGILD